MASLIETLSSDDEGRDFDLELNGSGNDKDDNEANAMNTEFEFGGMLVSSVYCKCNVIIE